VVKCFFQVDYSSPRQAAGNALTPEFTYFNYTALFREKRPENIPCTERDSRADEAEKRMKNEAGTDVSLLSLQLFMIFPLRYATIRRLSSQGFQVADLPANQEAG
jgi:hypothetical protein